MKVPPAVDVDHGPWEISAPTRECLWSSCVFGPCARLRHVKVQCTVRILSGRSWSGDGTMSKANDDNLTTYRTADSSRQISSPRSASPRLRGAVTSIPQLARNARTWRLEYAWIYMSHSPPPMVLCCWAARNVHGWCIAGSLTVLKTVWLLKSMICRWPRCQHDKEALGDTTQPKVLLATSPMRGNIGSSLTRYEAMLAACACSYLMCVRGTYCVGT